MTQNLFVDPSSPSKTLQLLFLERLLRSLCSRVRSRLFSLFFFSNPNLTLSSFFSFVSLSRLRPSPLLLHRHRTSLPTSLLHRPSISRRQSFPCCHSILGSDWAGTDRREEGRAGFCSVRSIRSEHEREGWELVGEGRDGLRGELGFVSFRGKEARRTES